jgi:hypothetical protein
LDCTVCGVYCSAFDIPTSHWGLDGEYNVIFSGAVTGFTSREISECCRECTSPHRLAANFVVEYSEMLVGSWRECGHATDVDEIERRVDIYSDGTVVLCDKYTDDIGREKMGDEVERRKGGKITEKEVGERTRGTAC